MEQEAHRQLPYDVDVEQALLGSILVDNYSLERVSTALKDPAVQSVGAYIGAGGATPTENQGRIFIALKPKSERPPITEVMARIGQAMRFT